METPSGATKSADLWGDIPTLSVAARELFDCSDDSCRQLLLEKRLALVDHEYEEFVSAIRSERMQSDLTSRLGALMLGLAGTLTEAARAKTNYAAAATLLAGATETLDGTLFYDQTLQALVGAMDANRATVRLKIRQSAHSMTIYPVADIHADLLMYERASTLFGAVSYIQITSRTLEVAAEDDMRKIHALPIDVRKMKICVTNALVPGNVVATLPTLTRVATRISVTPVGNEKTDRTALTTRLRNFNRHGTPEDVIAIFEALKAEAVISNCA